MVIKNVKPRAIYVYLPTQEQATKWKNLAHKSKASISRFVADHVENSLAQESQEQYQPRAELHRKIQTLQEENNQLRKQNRILEHAVDKLEKENRRFREKQWLEIEQPGTRTYETKLVQLLRSEGPLTDDQLLSRLAIQPTETDSVTAISNQLVSLQTWGLVRPTAKGWRWIE